MKRWIRLSMALTAGAVLVACGGGQDSSGTSPSASPQAAARERVQAAGDTRTAARMKALALPAAERAGVPARLARVKGPVDVWVTLAQPSVAGYKSERLAALGRDAQARARLPGVAPAAVSTAEKALASSVANHRQALRAGQDELMGRLQSLGARELGRVQTAHNAIAVRVDAKSLATIASMPGVAKVRPVVHYQLDLTETVPYTGARAVQSIGFDGRGVRVAVLDSGVDYTHHHLGGPGSLEAYAAAYGESNADPKNTTRDGLFPTAKVVDGHDFVGEVWPNCPDEDVDCRTEDPDPIDFDGHGTHVADIIAGRSLDGRHRGMAPGASVVAVKVCSAVTSSCNGVALIKGMDFALDPNNDGNPDDAVDVINLSLGSGYGQPEDDLAEAVSAAVRLGVVVVASAGNSGNLPFSVGSPSSTPGAISVAQTQVPSAQSYALVVNSPQALAGVYGNTATVPWAPLPDGTTGDVVPVGRGCPADPATGAAEDPYLADPAGKVALIDRGSCAVSLKVDRAARAGATAVVIANNVAGDAPSFSAGGGTQFVPTIVITLDLGARIKANLPVNVTLSDDGISLVGGIVASSARGPVTASMKVKPDIGAPGASVSALVGSGTGQEAFGGTSGAAPMVSGAAALLVQAYPTRTPAQIKAMLMNGASTNVFNNPAIDPGALAPVSRIGAGELRVNRAFGLQAIASVPADQSASLSFGFPNVTGSRVLTKTVLVENFGSTDTTFAIQVRHRHPVQADARSAVRVVAPSSVWVKAGGRSEVEVAMYIDAEKLPAWVQDGGPNGGNGALLTTNEFDGHLVFTAGSQRMSVPWHVLPRKAAEVKLAQQWLPVNQDIVLSNGGVSTGDFDVFALTGLSERSTDPLPGPGSNRAFVDLRAFGVRLVDFDDGSSVLQFAINTFGRRSHPNYPAEFDVYIDVNRDGQDDYVVYNIESGGFATSGRNVVVVLDLATNRGAAYYFTDTDLNSANVILTVPIEALGFARRGALKPMGLSVYAFDNYFTGDQTDQIEQMVFDPLRPTYLVSTDFGTVPRGSTVRLGTAQRKPASGVPLTQLGFLVMNRLDAGREAEVVRITP